MLYLLNTLIVHSSIGGIENGNLLRYSLSSLAQRDGPTEPPYPQQESPNGIVPEFEEGIRPSIVQTQT